LKTTVTIKNLGLKEFDATWNKMKQTISEKDINASHEVWLLEHPSVFTLGKSTKKDEVLINSCIPVVPTDRGGKATYHGPGQLVAYFIINLKALGWGPRILVNELETILVKFLKKYGIDPETKKGLPGVYVKDKKIASLGLKIKRGFSYHGVSINVDMDLTPFSFINVCGSRHQKVTQLKDYADIRFEEVRKSFEETIKNEFITS
tara:strand:- start:88999 stop:89613 length:615 start_codon:yes stop_codon:yes gene_type:complete